MYDKESANAAVLSLSFSEKCINDSFFVLGLVSFDDLESCRKHLFWSGFYPNLMVFEIQPSILWHHW